MMKAGMSRSSSQRRPMARRAPSLEMSPLATSSVSSAVAVVCPAIRFRASLRSFQMPLYSLVIRTLESLITRRPRVAITSFTGTAVVAISWFMPLMISW